MNVLDDIKADLTRSRENLLRESALVPDSMFDARATAESWSTADILDHLAAVERRIAGLLAKSIEGVPDSENMPALDTREIIDSVARLMGERASGPVKSSHIPATGHTRSELMRALQATRDDFFRLIDASAGIDLSEIVFPHPVLGNLNLYQFMVFVARHEDRHCGQIRRQRELLEQASSTH